MENPQNRQNAGSNPQNSEHSTAQQFLPQGRISETSIDFGSPITADVHDRQHPGDSTSQNQDAPCPPTSNPSDSQQPSDGQKHQDHGGTDSPHAKDDVGARAVSPTDIDQGNVGNCYFEASLASLANTPHGQEMIANMVKTNDDGSMTVTFPGDTSHPVTVTQEQMNNDVKNGKFGNESPTITAIQSAFLKYDRVGEYGTGINAVQGDGVPYFGQVSTPTDALHLLTGQDTAAELNGGLNSRWNIGFTSSDNLKGFMTQALNNEQPLVAGTSPITDPPLETGHEYSVLGFDQSTGTVTVRNPWSHNNGIAEGETKNGITAGANGTMTMSFDTFQKNFVEIAAAGVNPTETRLNDLGNDIASTAGSIGETFNDAFHGRFSEVLGDEVNVAGNVLQYGIDGATTAWNEAESVVGARIRGIYDTISRPLHGELPTGQDLMNAVGVPEPVMDAARTVTNAVADTASSVVNSVTSTVSDVWDDIF